MDPQQCGLMLGYAFVVVVIFYAIFKMLSPKQVREGLRSRDEPTNMSPPEILATFKKFGTRTRTARCSET